MKKSPRAFVSFLNSIHSEKEKVILHQQNVSIEFQIPNPSDDFQSSGMPANARTLQPKK